MTDAVAKPEIRKMVDLWHRLGSVAAVARELGRSIPTVRKYLAQSGISSEEIDAAWRWRSWTESDLTRLRRMYKGGKSIRECAAALGKTYNTTRLALIRQDVTLRKQGVNGGQEG